MNFGEFKKSLKYKKYKTWKIIVRFIEYKFKNLTIDLVINLNKFKSKFDTRKIIDIGSYSDNSYINFLIYSLKDEFLFSYNRDKHTKKLFKRIGLINFFKHTISNLDVNKNIWNKETNSWESLPGRYRGVVRDGISMAKKLKTVDMLELPVPAAEVVQ